MQLIWMSGPTDRVVTLSLTRGKVAAALVGMAVFFLLLGSVFQLVGLRVAIEHVPTLAHKIGGVASLQEQQRVEAQYSARLAQLQQQLAQTAERLQQLEAGRQALFARIGLGALTPSGISKNDKLDGRGGPFIALWPLARTSLSGRLDETADKLGLVHRSVEQAHADWGQQHGRLDALPLALPIQSDFSLSSSFGVRSDPMTHLPSMHEGIDFVAPSGTPILATAPGVVVQARYNGAYGNMVEVEHAEGFVTRYAHLQSMSVQVGQKVRPGDRVGLLGNTGRSTGPHLHYEVLFQGQAMHPVKAVQRWSRS